MNEIEKFEKASEIADARLDIAEVFSWLVAVLLASLVLLKWDSWLLAIGGFAIGFFLSTYHLRKESSAAEEAFMKASKTGRYYEGPAKADDQS